MLFGLLLLIAFCRTSHGILFQISKREFDGLFDDFRIMLLENSFAKLHNRDNRPPSNLLRGFEELSKDTDEPLLFSHPERLRMLLNIFDDGRANFIAPIRSFEENYRWVWSVGRLLLYSPTFGGFNDDEVDFFSANSADLFTNLMTSLFGDAQVIWELGCVYFSGRFADQVCPIPLLTSELSRLASWFAAFHGTYPKNLIITLGPIQKHLLSLLQIYFYGVPFNGQFQIRLNIWIAALYLGIGSGLVKLDTQSVYRANLLMIQSENDLSNAISAALENIPAARDAERRPSFLNDLRQAHLINPRAFFRNYAHSINYDRGFISRLSSGEIEQVILALMEHPISLYLESVLSTLLQSKALNGPFSSTTPLIDNLWNFLINPSKGLKEDWISVLGKLIVLHIDMPFAIKFLWNILDACKVASRALPANDRRRQLIFSTLQLIKDTIRVKVHTGTFLKYSSISLIHLFILSWPSIFTSSGGKASARWIETLSVRYDFNIVYESFLNSLYSSPKLAEILHAFSLGTLMRLAYFHRNQVRKCLTWSKMSGKILEEIFGRSVLVLEGVDILELFQLYLSESKLTETLEDASILAQTIHAKGLIKDLVRLSDKHENLVYILYKVLHEAKESATIDDFAEKIPLPLLKAVLHCFRGTVGLSWVKLTSPNQSGFLSYSVAGLAALVMFIRPYVAASDFMLVQMTCQLRIADISKECRHVLIFLRVFEDDTPLDWCVMQAPLLDRMGWNLWQKKAAVSLANGRWMLPPFDIVMWPTKKELSEFLLYLDQTCVYERSESQLKFLQENIL